MARYNTLSKEDKRRLYAGYYGNIAFMDSQVSRLLAKALMDRNTYVIFTSDHGEMLGDHYLMQKNRPYEGAVHIPFMVMGPDIPDGQLIDAPVSWTDIMPTILELAGLSVPSSVDGRSLVPFLRGQMPETWRSYIHGECCHDFMFDAKVKPCWKTHNFVFEQGSQYITDGRLKYIWYVTSGKEQLFDVVTDFKEQNDLSADPVYSDQLAAFRSALIQELDGRPEGFSDGERLIPGCTPVKTNARMQALAEQRQKEGFTLAFGRRCSPIDALEYQNTLMD